MTFREGEDVFALSDLHRGAPFAPLLETDRASLKEWLRNLRDKFPAPCDDCTLFDVCRVERIACADYGTWLSKGRVEHTVREPSAELMRIAESRGSVRALRAAAGTSPAGQPKLGRPSKLSKTQILEIFAAHGKKLQSELAAEYGVSRSLIGEIHRGFRHSDITGHSA